MQNGWAVDPPLPMPPCPEGVSAEAHAAVEVAKRAKLFADAVSKSIAASERRGRLRPGSSRAAVTTANAAWNRAAEHRQRMEANLGVALEAAGLRRPTF